MFESDKGRGEQALKRKADSVFDSGFAVDSKLTCSSRTRGTISRRGIFALRVTPSKVTLMVTMASGPA